MSYCISSYQIIAWSESIIAYKVIQKEVSIVFDTDGYFSICVSVNPFLLLWHHNGWILVIIYHMNFHIGRWNQRQFMGKPIFLG